jgi:transcriptional regulator with XRE-family HTH domain
LEIAAKSCKVCIVPASTVRRQRLASQLRQLRERAGLTLEDVAARTDVATSTLSRIETGQIGAKPIIVKAMLDLYGVAGADAEALVQLARDARARGWWHQYLDVIKPGYADYIALEAEAEAVYNYEPTIMPGLLQTAAYYEAIGSAGADLDSVPADVRSRLTELRLARQRRLTEWPPLRFHAIVEETLLRRVVGDEDVLREQLEHIGQLARLENVTVQVIPERVGSHPGLLGGFSILTFDDPEHRPDVGYVQFIAGQVFLQAEQEVARCHDLFRYLSTVALSNGESMELVASVAGSL